MYVAKDGFDISVEDDAIKLVQVNNGDLDIYFAREDMENTWIDTLHFPELSWFNEDNLKLKGRSEVKNSVTEYVVKYTPSEENA